MDNVAILLGWPALTAALLLSAAGARFEKPAMIWIALALTTPIAFYLSGSPTYPFLGIVPVLALTVSAVTCRMPRRWPCIAGIGAYAIFLAWLALLVFA